MPLRKKNSNSKSTNDDTAAGTLRKRTKRAVENEELMGTVTSGNIPEESLDLDNIWDNPESKALEDSIRKESQITAKILNNRVFQQDSDQRNSTTTPNTLPRRTQNMQMHQHQVRLPIRTTINQNKVGHVHLLPLIRVLQLNLHRTLFGENSTILGQHKVHDLVRE